MNEHITKVLKEVIRDLDERSNLSFTGSIGSIEIPCEDYYHALGSLETLVTLLGEADDEDD